MTRWLASMGVAVAVLGAVLLVAGLSSAYGEHCPTPCPAGANCTTQSFCYGGLTGQGTTLFVAGLAAVVAGVAVAVRTMGSDRTPHELS